MAGVGGAMHCHPRFWQNIRRCHRALVARSITTCPPALRFLNLPTTLPLRVWSCRTRIEVDTQLSIAPSCGLYVCSFFSEATAVSFRIRSFRKIHHKLEKFKIEANFRRFNYFSRKQSLPSLNLKDYTMAKCKI